MARALAPPMAGLVRAVLNRLIPAGDGFPGAGDLDLADGLDRAASASASTTRVFVDGIREIALRHQARCGGPFEDADPAEQDATLRHVEEAAPLFFDLLLRHVYVLYYSHPDVMPLLGLERRPPQPLGYPLPPFDGALVDAMGRRRPLYREA